MGYWRSSDASQPSRKHLTLHSPAVSGATVAQAPVGGGRTDFPFDPVKFAEGLGGCDASGWSVEPCREMALDGSYGNAEIGRPAITLPRCLPAFNKHYDCEGFLARACLGGDLGGLLRHGSCPPLGERVSSPGGFAQNSPSRLASFLNCHHPKCSEGNPAFAGCSRILSEEGLDPVPPDAHSETGQVAIEHQPVLLVGWAGSRIDHPLRQLVPRHLVPFAYTVRTFCGPTVVGSHVGECRPKSWGKQ